MGAAVTVRGLHKHYGAVHAVRGIDLDLEAGRVTAVLGPNGAGKTTTLEILEGFRDRDAGDVTVLGMDPRRADRRFRERVGIVLQETAVEEYLTVRELLALHAGYYPRPRHVDDVIELVGLSEKAHARVKGLSGGQRRRLDVGLGIVGDPELLFLDEPTTGFDPSARRAAWELVRTLSGGGTTIVLTTHYIDEAQALADTVIVIADGTVVATGAPDELAERLHTASRAVFRLPDGIDPAALPVPAQRLDSGLVQVDLSDGDDVRALHALTGWAIDRGVELAGLRVTRATLEDAYLALVGGDVAEVAQ